MSTQISAVFATPWRQTANRDDPSAAMCESSVEHAGDARNRTNERPDGDPRKRPVFSAGALFYRIQMPLPVNEAAGTLRIAGRPIDTIGPVLPILPRFVPPRPAKRPSCPPTPINEYESLSAG
jgi:hypothetical protein